MPVPQRLATPPVRRAHADAPTPPGAPSCPPSSSTARGKQFSACAPSATKFDNGRRLCIVSGNVVPGSATVTLQGWTDNKLKSAKGVITISGVDKGGKERWRWTLQANPASANQYGNWSPCSGNASDNNCFSNPAPFRVVAQAVHLTASVNMVFEFSSPT